MEAVFDDDAIVDEFTLRSRLDLISEQLTEVLLRIFSLSAIQFLPGLVLCTI